MENVEIKKAWTTFARETLEQDEVEATETQVNRFGFVMYRVYEKYGTIDSQLWEGDLPSGTEDRVWVRAYFAATAGKYAGLFTDLDGAFALSCVSKMIES